MRKYILLLILSCFHVMSRGQTPIEIDLSGVPEPTHAESIRYWFDDDAGTLSTSTLLNGSYTLDASPLLDGLHTIHYQIVDSKGMVTSPSTAIFMKLNDAVADKQGTAAQLSYWFDDQSSVTTTSTVNGIMTLDASPLLDGLHTIHYQITDADGEKGYIASAIFMKMNNMVVNNGEPVTAKKLMYWFDDETEQRNMDMSTGIQMLDASHLLDGLHTLHYQVICSDGTITSAYSAIFMRMNVEIDNSAVAAKSLRYWFDDSNDVNTAEMLSGTYMLDASTLLDGLHTIHYQVVDVNGGVGGVSTSIFMKMDMTSTETATSARKQRYWFDDDKSTLVETGIAQGTQMLDVSQLLMGLHTVHYQLVDENGDVSAPYTALFMKMDNGKTVDEKNAITGYMYWLNDESVDNAKVKIDKASNPYQLTTLLPMIKAPIRSNSFLFEVKDGVPMIYAKNDLHVRFEDAVGYWVDDSRSFVDYSVSEAVANITDLQSTQTFARPDENGIKWFKFEAAPGDTIAFKASQATSLQVFAPCGKEIYSTMGDKSVVYGGTHTWEDGTYYVAVHDVTGSRPNITLDYMHMDKYDVVDQDVRIVGNGGCSTITFQGNGFRSLYAVDLYTAHGDTIHSLDVGHESDAETSVTFDFTGIELGKYNALFHFTEEDKVLPNNITVEEAKEIELVTRVSYPSIFLRGTAVTYTVEITNKGNMTAYMVPLEMKIIVDDIKNVQSIQFDGFLKSLVMTNSYNFEDLEPEDIEDIRQIISNSNDLSQFIIYHDSINGKDYGLSQVIMTLPPKSTQTISISIKSTANVNFEAWTTNDWFPIACKETSIRRARSMKAPSRESMCCMKDKFECGAEIVANIAGAFMPPGAGCLSSLSLTGLETAYDVWCSEGNSVSERWNNYLKNEGNSLASRLIQSAVTCITGYYGAKIKALREDQIMASKLGSTTEVERISAEIAACRTAQYSAVRNIYDGITTMILGGSCYKAFTEIKPNCPPNPGGGGGSSTPVNSLDPNDIYGFVSRSGSKYIGEDIVTLPYRIEFENDTTFATASAHTVIVKDTLDATKFDLASYQPTSITIGDKNVQLKGDKEFVTTVDMRPEINAIAQIEGMYDEKKGIATWQFTSLDPMTMEPTDDIMQGFLPVNFDGSGIGEVAFNINRKAGLTDGTEIKNRASITFDANDPILTPTWTNIIDAVPPTSHVSGLEQVNDTIMRLTFDGEDNRSGVWKYTLYVQDGLEAPWREVATDIAPDSVYTFQGFDCIDYGFCVLATDSAGNVEKKQLKAEKVRASYHRGDANCDGAITVSDIVATASYILGQKPESFSVERADCDGNGTITVSDIVYMAQYILNGEWPTQAQVKAILKRNRWFIDE